MLLALLRNLGDAGGGSSSALSYSGSKIKVYVVTTTGRTKWVHYLPVEYVILSNTAKVNTYDDAGALAVQTLSSTTGLREWVDYKPVVIVTPTREWSYDDTGCLRVVEVT